MLSRVLLGSAVFVVGLSVGYLIGVNLFGSPETQNATTVDLASLRSDPGRYAGKLVQLTGQLDECFGWECSLCPESMTTANADLQHCLPIEFRPLMPGTGFGAAAKEAVFRFSSVKLVARFDPTCLEVPCFDRGTILHDADVISVSDRRASRDGLWIGRTTPLEEAPRPLADAIQAKAVEAGYRSKSPIKVFIIKSDPQKAIVCWTAAEASWPNTVEAALYAKSTTDFYSCNKVEKSATDWVIKVQE